MQLMNEGQEQDIPLILRISQSNNRKKKESLCTFLQAYALMKLEREIPSLPSPFQAKTAICHIIPQIHPNNIPRRQDSSECREVKTDEPSFSTRRDWTATRSLTLSTPLCASLSVPFVKSNQSCPINKIGQVCTVCVNSDNHLPG